jgi:ligand-binding sensor domain-containing protein/serine phosphatase RsbU (regulator of sigma subunit)
MRHLILYVTIALLSITSYAQKYKFSSFTATEGLNDPFIYDMVQTNNGYLLVGTGEGLARYDGKNIITYKKENGLNSNLVTCIEMDSSSNTAFIGHNDGSLSKYHKGNITAFERDSNCTSKIQTIKLHRDESVWALSQSQGFIVFNKKGEISQRIQPPIEDIIMYDFAFLDNNIIIASSEGLLISPLQTISSKKSKPTILYPEFSWTKLFSDSKKNTVYGACENGVYGIQKDKKEFAAKLIIKNTLNGPSSLLKDKGNFWIAGREGAEMYSLQKDGKYELVESYNASKGLPANYVSALHRDNMGNLWFGTYGEGLHLLVDQFFTFYGQDDPQASSNTTAIYTAENTRYFAVEETVYAVFSDNIEDYKMLNSSNGLPSDKYNAIVEHKGIWLGSHNNGLYYAKDVNSNFKKINLSIETLSDYIYDLKIFKNRLWVGTESGVYVVNPENQKVEATYNTAKGLRHNKVYSFMVDNDTIWVATISNYLTGISNGSVIEKELDVGNNLLSIVNLKKDNQGNIWLATLNNGVLRLSPNNEVTGYASNKGLLSDHCYAMTIGDDGDVWIGHRYGISRINAQDEIFIYNEQDGISGEINLNAIEKDSNGNIWIGTTDGIIRYNPVFDVSHKGKPFVDLRSVSIDGEVFTDKYDFDLAYDNHELTFLFKGISLSNSKNIYFQYRLKGHNDNWTKTKEGQANFSNIRSGNYTFMLRVCNGSGECRDLINEITISVDKPIWMKWWFVSALVLFAILTVMFIIRVRTFHLRKAQKELEHQLSLRTRQIVDQKEVIEEKNKNITDSINYAKRIQNKMLPDTSELSKKLPGAFVFFRPRDIVSGDFYWFKKIDDRLIVVVSDCTGHGVPGAFMSLIGGVALKHICSLDPNLSPKGIMESLNDDVSNILQQKIPEEDRSTIIRDGMDIIISEFNLTTNVLTVSSAKRPYFVKQNAKLKRFNGDRMSIGGELNENGFTEKTFNISRGDAIYMFTDGYNDQFGGPKNKKMQLRRVFDLIENNLDSDSEEMQKLIASNFQNWIGKEDQIDDVLFMGIHF